MENQSSSNSAKDFIGGYTKFNFARLFNGDFTGFDPSRTNALELMIRLACYPSKYPKENFECFIFGIDDNEEYFQFDHLTIQPPLEIVCELRKQFVQMKEEIFFEGTNYDLYRFIESICSSFKEVFGAPLSKSRIVKPTSGNIQGFRNLLMREEFLFEPTVVKILSKYAEHLISDIAIKISDRNKSPETKHYHDLLEEMCENELCLIDGRGSEFTTTVRNYVLFVVHNGLAIRYDPDYEPHQYSSLEEEQEAEQLEAIIEEKDCLLSQIGNGNYHCLTFSEYPDGIKYLDEIGFDGGVRAQCRAFVAEHPEFRQEFVDALSREVLYFPSLRKLEQDLQDVKQEREGLVEELISRRLSTMKVLGYGDSRRRYHYQSEEREKIIGVDIVHLESVIKECKEDIEIHPDSSKTDCNLDIREAALTANMMYCDFVLDEEHDLECKREFYESGQSHLPGKNVKIVEYKNVSGLENYGDFKWVQIGLTRRDGSRLELYGVPGIISQQDKNGNIIFERIPVPGFDYPGWHHKHGDSGFNFKDPKNKNPENFPLIGRKTGRF